MWGESEPPSAQHIRASSTVPVTDQRRAVGHTDKTRVRNQRYTSLRGPHRGPATPRGGRRLSLRRGKRVRYNEDKGEGRHENVVEEDNEVPGSSARGTQRTADKKSASFVELSVLPVTCGSKNGNLDIQQLARGEACIECDGSWYSPRAFEKHGGRGSRKKWKSSIFYENQPLELLFKQGHLTTPMFQKRNTEDKKISPPDVKPHIWTTDCRLLQPACLCQKHVRVTRSSGKTEYQEVIVKRQEDEVKITEEETENDRNSSCHGEDHLHTQGSEGHTQPVATGNTNDYITVQQQAIMITTLQKISDSLERLSSKQDTVIELLKRLTDQD